MPSKFAVGTRSEITLLTLMSIMVVGQLYVVLPLFAAMAASFGCSPARLAMASSAFGVPYAFAGLIAGPLADAWGAKRVIILSLAATALTTFAVSFAPSFIGLVLLRGLQGITAGFLSVASFAYIARHLREDMRTFATTSIMAAAMSSALLMQIFGQFMVEEFGWRSAFFGPALAMILLAGAGKLFLARTSQLLRSSVIHSIVGLPSILREKPLVALYGSALTLLGGFVSVFAAIALYGPPEIRNHPEKLFLLRALSLPVMIVVPFLALQLKDYRPQSRIAGGLGMSAVSMTVAAMVSQNVWILATSIAVCTTGLLISAPAIVQSVTQYEPNKSGASVALYTFAVFIGASLAPQFAVLLSPVGLSGLLLAVAVLFVMALFLGTWGASYGRAD